MENVRACQNGREEKNFTLRKFLLTGRELAVESRGSLHTGHGKVGAAIFLMGLGWGIYGAVTKENLEKWSNFVLLADLWCAMGLVNVWNLQNYKLLYLLPVSRKDFAAMQIRKMAWLCLVLFGITAVQYASMGLGAEDFWKLIFCKAIPASLSLGVYQVSSVQPIRGKAVNGYEIYGLSFTMLLLDFGIAFLNLIMFPATGGISFYLLPILNYGIGIYAAVYLYRKIAFAGLYYDEL